MDATDNITAGTHRGWRARWGSILAFMFRVMADPDTSPRCAAAAFFGFLSFFPGIGTLTLIYGIVANRTLVAQTVDAFRYILPPMGLDILDQQLQSLAAAPHTTLGLGLLIAVPLALWSGSRGVQSLLFALSRVRGEPEKRHFLVQIFVSIGMTIGGSIFLAVALAAIAVLPALLPFPADGLRLLLWLRWPALLAISAVVLALLYRWGPDRHPRKLRYLWPGAVLASLLWLVASWLFSLYVENWGHYSATFGSVTAAVVLMLWMYNSVQIFVLGAAFNAALEREDGVLR
jgi:membrane protein